MARRSTSGSTTNAHVGTRFAHQSRYVGEIFRDRFGIVGKLACSLAIQTHDILDPHSLKQFGNCKSAYRIHCIDSHFESGIAHSFHIDGFQCEHLLDVPACISSVGVHFAQTFHRGELKIGIRGHFKHTGTFGCVEEFAVLIKKLQGVPLAWIV